MSNPDLQQAVFNALIFSGLIGCIIGFAVTWLAHKLFFRPTDED